MTGSRSNFADVGEFHQKMGLHNVTFGEPGPRTDLSPYEMDKLIDFRVDFMQE